ncbi:MAG: dihydrolipoamide acetyltransferase family protein [Alphaproteobacteria bacterium]
MTTFNLPDLGEGLDEAEIVSWHVTPGDHVVADQPLVAVETDKAVVEIPSPQSGTIETLFAAVGAHLKVGAPLVSFADTRATDTGTVVGRVHAPARPEATPDTKPEASPAVAMPAPRAAPAQAAPRPTAPPTPPPMAPTAMATPSGAVAHIKAMPRARGLARRLGIDLALVKGSGPEDIITETDVEAAAQGAAALVTEGEPLRGPRRAMARNMARSHASVVPATVHDEADVDSWAGPDADVTARLIRAMASGARASPMLNSWLDGEQLLVRRHARVDVGLAMETDDGLFAPVIRDAASLTLAQIRAAIEALKIAVRSRTVDRDGLMNATITLSNFGVFAGRHAALVVAPPQVAILGAGRLAAQAMVRDGRVVSRRTLPLSLSFDHRAVTGAEAARFLAAVIGDLERET